MKSPPGAPNGCIHPVPCWISAVHTGAPAEPRLVKTWMTPAEASVPYRVVAAEPLMTSMRSMSLGLIMSSGVTVMSEGRPSPVPGVATTGKASSMILTPST